MRVNNNYTSPSTFTPPPRPHYLGEHRPAPTEEGSRHPSLGSVAHPQRSHRDSVRRGSNQSAVCHRDVRDGAQHARQNCGVH